MNIKQDGYNIEECHDTICNFPNGHTRYQLPYEPQLISLKCVIKNVKMQVAISLDNLNLRNKRIMFTMQQQRGTLLQILPSCNDNNLSAPAASLTNPCSPIFITLHLSFIVGASFITSATGEGSERISLCYMQSFQAQMTKR